MTVPDRTVDAALDEIAEACGGWPQPNRYDDALAAVRAEIERLREEVQALEAVHLHGCDCGTDDACKFWQRAEAVEARVRRDGGAA